MNSPAFHRFTDKDLASVPRPITIAERDVHVWGVELDADSATAGLLRQTLSVGERRRVDRLTSDRRREERIVAYAGLRIVLSRYCGCDPRELKFRRTRAGKPELRANGRDVAVRFNLTHSQGRALIAVARSRNVGVDLEAMHRRHDVLRLARRFLSPQEAALLEQAEPGGAHALFVRLWVAKEAALKARGTGLRFPLTLSRVELSSDRSEARLLDGGGRRADAGYIVKFLPIDAGWIAAVAASGDDWRIVTKSPAKLCPAGAGRSPARAPGFPSRARRR